MSTPYPAPDAGDPDQPYARPTQTFSIAAFISAFLALACCVYLFGPLGVILGILGHKNGERLGKWAAIASGIAMVVGVLAGLVFFNGSTLIDRG